MLLRFLYWLQSVLPFHCIMREGEPYNDRSYLLGKDGNQKSWRWLRRSRLNCFLHHFRNSDTPDKLHNHPYRYGFSFILRGGYLEERQREVHPGQFSGLERRYLKAGRFNWIGPNDYHRIELLDPQGAWTLFISWGKFQQWGFRDRFTGEFTVASGKT